MRVFSYLFLIIIMLVGLTFAALNSGLVTFNYYLGTQEIALSLLLVFALGVGIAVGMLFAIFSWLKVKHGNMRLKARLQVVEKEVANLRSLPIKGD